MVDSLALIVSVDAIFTGTTASEESMSAALKTLTRDDALFTCARINAMVSGFGPDLSNHHRQNAAISRLCSQEEMLALSRYAVKHGGPERVMAFFRGQLLELARWITLYCRHQAGDGETFADAAVRSAFVRAALIASDLWQRRLFGDVIQPSLDRDGQIRQFMGSFRKSMEEGNGAGHPGLTMSRGWTLFSRYVPKYLPEFGELFERSTNLTLRQYFICATALMNRTFSDHPENGRIFQTDYVRGTTSYKEVFRRFIGLLSQTPEEWAKKLRAKTNDSGHLSLRERPILNFDRGRSIIFDPTFYLDNLTIAPLFYLKTTGVPMIRVFSAFGLAFEEYARNLLERRFPDGSGVLYQPLKCNVEGRNAQGHKFEIDAVLNDVLAAAVIEMKAGLIREETVLADDPEIFLDEIRVKYGHIDGSVDRDKGVAQLARSIGALVRREWAGPAGEYSNVKQIYPVLAVFDIRMAAPGCCYFLDSEFRKLLGVVPLGIQVHPLIVMTIDDVEHLVSGVESLSLMEFLRAYSAADPDRIGSVHNFIAGSGYMNQVRSSPFLAAAFDELMQAVREELGPETTRSSEENA